MLAGRTRRRLTNNVSKIALAVAMIGAPGAAPTVASAASCSWIGGTGLWGNAGNWSCGVVPGSSDTVAISTAGSVVTVQSANQPTGALTLGGGNQLILDNTFLQQSGDVANSGTITVRDASNLINQAGSLSYTGTGSIVLDNSTNYARISGGTITFGAGQTVSGSGEVGTDNTFFINNGKISANVAAGGITIDAGGGNGSVSGGVGVSGTSAFYNTSILEGNGATLSIAGGRYENSVTGVIQAVNSGTVALGNDVRIIGGTLTSDATSQINAFNTTQYFESVTLSSGSKLNLNNDFLNVNTSLTNNGTITISNASRIANESAAYSLNGTGTIVLDNSSNYARITGGAVTIGSGQTIRGSGEVGVDNTVLTNNGLISADVTTGTGSITIDAGGGNGGLSGAGVGTGGNAGMLNNATLQATNGGTLIINGGLYENAANGVMKAINGSTLQFNDDVRVLGGTLTSDASSKIVANNDHQYFQSVVLSSGSKLGLNNDFLYVNTALTNNGTITLANASILSNDATTPYAINGTGTIVLDDTANYARLVGGTVTYGSGQTIRGSGQIGVDATIITNNALISADVTTGTGSITIDAQGGNGGLSGAGVGTGGNAGMLNNATLQATNGGTLIINGGLYENAANGAMKAINGSTLQFNDDVRVLGGTLTSDASSKIVANNDHQYFQSVVLSSGSKLGLNNDFLYVNTALTNNGTITLANASILSNDAATAYVINGTGTIVLDDTANYARLVGGKVTYGSGQTIRGSGQIGVDATIITNNALISADVTGRSIIIDAQGGNGGLSGAGVGTGGNAGLLNNATIQAIKGSTLIINGGLYENAANGVMQAINGSTLQFNDDVRVLGGTLTSDASSQIIANNDHQYFQSVTLSTGSKLGLNNDFLYVNTVLINNGTITLANASFISNDTVAPYAINGTGTIVLDDSGNYARLVGGTVTYGSGQTIRGSGQIGVDATIITNNGLISADVTTGTGSITIDAQGGNAGLSGAGVGTGGNAAFYNAGLIQATNGGTVGFSGGLYENAATGELRANGGTVSFNGDASLANLQSGGVLSKGVYTANNGGTLSIRSNAADSIVTIGTNSATRDTVVTLNGAGSTIQVTGFNSGTVTTLDASLAAVAQSGTFQVLGGRNFTVVANGGAFSNAGQVQLGGGAFGAATYANSGTTTGFGSVTVDIANTGTVNAAGGTLATQAILGTTGTVSTNSGATLSLGGNSTAGLLINNGTLALNGHSVTVTTDYQNASFGSGNAFNGHANVTTGGGQILAASATMDLSGSALSGNTLNVGNVRVGGSSSAQLTITNNGTSTTLRGAVQNTNAPSVALSNANFVLAANGGSSTATISFTGAQAGSLAGQSVNVVNNFDNVAAKTVNLQGAVYQIAQAGSVPTTVDLGAQRVGSTGNSNAITISNVAPNTNGFTESLSSTASVGGPFSVNGSSSATTANLAAGGSQNLTLAINTGTSGAFTKTVLISNTSVPVAGSGFTPLALDGQSVTVSGKVYQAAQANLSSNTVNFGTVRGGTANVTAGVSVTNGASGALVDNLTTSVGVTPGNITKTSSPGALSAGQSGSVVFGLDTATSGQVSGSTSLGFQSTDADLSALTLNSQTVNFKGTVTQVAQANLVSASSVGTLTGGASSYTLNLGAVTAGDTANSGFAVMNGISASTFAELLSGSFTAGPSAGFTFGGMSFSDLGGLQTTGLEGITFNSTGLATGIYSDIITLKAFSSYDGLSDLQLTPITLDIVANVTGATGPIGPTGAVPEPSTWAELLVGFGALGAFMRRRRRTVVAA